MSRCEKSSISWVTNLHGDKNAECKLSKGWSWSCRQRNMLPSVGKWVRSYFNSVHTRCIAETSGFTRGVSKKRGFTKFKGFLVEFLENRRSWENQKPPENRQKSGLFWSSPFTTHLVCTLLIIDDPWISAPLSVSQSSNIWFPKIAHSSFLKRCRRWVAFWRVSCDRGAIAEMPSVPKLLRN